MDAGQVDLPRPRRLKAQACGGWVGQAIACRGTLSSQGQSAPRRPPSATCHPPQERLSFPRNSGTLVLAPRSVWF